jgi:hypothetical protein
MEIYGERKPAKANACFLLDLIYRVDGDGAS